MEEVKSRNSSDAFPMTGGVGLHSYSKNSSAQRGAIVAVKELIKEAISKCFDMKIISSSSNKNAMRIADMGCSVGPNTFLAIQNIIEAIQLNNSDSQDPVKDFQVFLNDHSSNDFNTLFASLPSDRQYFATGVPGSFYTRLFPASSLHIVHSSYALQWLSQVPKELTDKSSRAWNKGRIYYSSSGDEVVKVYVDQFCEDINKFLLCRAEEIVPGGLILMTFPGRSNGTPHSQVFSNVSYHLLGSCLMDLVSEGLISEEKVDSLNIPVYFTSPKEVEEAVQRNGCFDIERVELIPINKSESSIEDKAKSVSLHIRAGMEPLLKHHLGPQILDQLFNNFVVQLQQSDVFQFGVAFSLFLLLKRKLLS